MLTLKGKCIASLSEFDSFSKELLKKLKNSKIDKSKFGDSLLLIEDFNNTLDEINTTEDSFISPTNIIENINENFSFAYEQQVSMGTYLFRYYPYIFSCFNCLNPCCSYLSY